MEVGDLGVIVLEISESLYIYYNIKGVCIWNMFKIDIFCAYGIRLKETSEGCFYLKMML